jgi:hypothetical protein
MQPPKRRLVDKLKDIRKPAAYLFIALTLLSSGIEAALIKLLLLEEIGTLVAVFLQAAPLVIALAIIATLVFNGWLREDPNKTAVVEVIVGVLILAYLISYATGFIAPVTEQYCTGGGALDEMSGQPREQICEERTVSFHEQITDAPVYGGKWAGAFAITYLLFSGYGLTLSLSSLLVGVFIAWIWHRVGPDLLGCVRKLN